MRSLGTPGVGTAGAAGVVAAEAARFSMASTAGGGGGPGGGGDSGGALEPESEGRELPSMVLETGKLLLAGGIAGAVSKSATAPLARLTILYQVSGSMV